MMSWSGTMPSSREKPVAGSTTESSKLNPPHDWVPLMSSETYPQIRAWTAAYTGAVFALIAEDNDASSAPSDPWKSESYCHARYTARSSILPSVISMNFKDPIELIGVSDSTQYPTTRHWPVSVSQLLSSP